MDFQITLLPGDGIGPEVIEKAVQILQIIEKFTDNRFHFSKELIGGCSIDANGTSLTEEVLNVCRQSDAVLLGAVGGPKWDNPDSNIRPEQGLLALRKGLKVYANLRPVKVHPALMAASPLKEEKLSGVDMLVVRELTGGLYFGEPKGRSIINGQEHAVDTLIYSEEEIRRIVKMSFELARNRRKKVTSVDKANVLESSRLWRKVAMEVSRDFPDVILEHMLVDTASMRLVTSPSSFDVIVTENMFGDILTDEASVLTGSMGMLPSASLGNGKPGLYEPIHGSAPDIAGKGIANPIGMILSAALMLRFSLQMEKEALMIEQAVNRTIADGCRTADMGGSLSTEMMTEEIIRRIHE